MASSLPPSPLLVTAFNGLVAAYDRATGDTQWTFAVPGKSVPGVRARPTHVEVHDERVFVLVGGAEGTFTKNSFVELLALDYHAGRLLWTQRLESRPSPQFPGAQMLVEGGQVIVASFDVLAAFDADSGRVQWSRVSEHGDGGLHLPTLDMGVHGARSRPLT
ncbi:PQQ-like beta-propeller repeat protein [Myxococcus sp. K15C18031901]|uniref:outer membrane protein assembly factor BamB family protein n=1 Tax=Myxococcus dinghuensis TaxID=2906761 RepID=UPI0020A779B3|nr:PQQ-binding-like beta-propeller repeat protein [Myxococcus dinghuensis]MCP3099799.1 PQQ-like beta-propeller repeat protein [Myxococcus dinghuensis]